MASHPIVTQRGLLIGFLIKIYRIETNKDNLGISSY